VGSSGSAYFARQEGFESCHASSRSINFLNNFSGMCLAFAPAVRRYEQFTAWQLARDLHMRVMKLTSSPPAYSDFKFRDNMRDAADSAQRNFPEGFGRFAPGDFARFLDHSRASLLEVKNELGVGLDRGYWSEADYADADTLANRALKALSGLQAYLRSPQAKRNAARARAAHIARHSARTNPRT
jgi:four helix bundle protein